MKKQIITLAVAALLLSSCGIYTKYERPEVKTDGLYGQDVEVEDTTSIASLSWRELFTDPQLQSLIEHALQGNTDLQSAHWRIKEAEATLSSVRLAYLPSFMLSAASINPKAPGRTPVLHPPVGRLISSAN